MPEWLRGDILDVRMSVMQLLNTHSAAAPSGSAKVSRVHHIAQLFANPFNCSPPIIVCPLIATYSFLMA